MTPEVALTLPWGYIHVYYHSSQISLLVSQVSGERLQDHWSSGFLNLLKLIIYQFLMNVCAQPNHLGESTFIIRAIRIDLKF